jgi:two-component system, NarL family, sensor histidine kinase DesK
MPARGAEKARWPTAFALLIICLLFCGRALYTLALNGPVTTDDLYQVFLAAVLFVIPILFVFPNTRELLIRYRLPALATQSVLTWVPFALFGSRWQVGIGGLLAGLVLLCFSGWCSWLAAFCLLVGDVALRAAVTGLPWEPAWSGALWATVAFSDTAIVTFGIIRLTQLIEDLQAARGQAAEFGAAAERLRAAEVLDTAVYDGLGEVATKVATAERLYSCDIAEASTAIRRAGVIARQASSRARELFGNHGLLEPPRSTEVPLGESLLGARLAWGVLVAVLCGYAAAGINDAYGVVSRRLLAVLAAGTVCFVALQLYHSWLAHQDRRGSIWPLTLVMQAAVAYAFFLPPIAVYFTIAGFLAGSILLLAPERMRLAGFVAVVVSWSVLHALVPVHGQSPAARSALINLYVANSLLLTGLLVYGLSRLVDTARQLEAVRAGLAHAAGTVERLRLARDVHDLLGLGLSALALKADLVEQLMNRHDPKAANEIQLMGRICATTRADVRHITTGKQTPTLKEEVTAASDILASAGIEVHIAVPSDHLGPTMDELLVPVLRESVTNILRHSAATVCSIEVDTQVDRVRLAVDNNGVAGGDDRAVWNRDQTDTVTGRGLGLHNLRSRVRDAGGELLTRQSSDHFHVVADIPTRSR